MELLNETIKSPADACYIPSYSQLKVNFVRRSTRTKTEVGVLDRIPKEGLDIGHISNAILYSPVMDRFSRVEKRAIANLIYNRVLVIAEGIRVDTGAYTYILRLA